MTQGSTLDYAVSAKQAFLDWLGDYDVALLKGTTQPGSYRFQQSVESIKLVDVLKCKLETLTNGDLYISRSETHPPICFYDIMGSYMVGPSNTDKTQMRMVKGPKFFGANRESGQTLFATGKPAKMIKKIIPAMTEQDCQNFAIWWKDTFCQDQTLIVKTGETRQDFKHMYTGDRVKDSHFEYTHETYKVKSLNNSCMRHTFGSIHPSEAYASGDFLAIWTEDSQGLIHSRCVVRSDPSWVSPAPIYTASKAGIDTLSDYIVTMGKPIKMNMWSGASLLKLESEHGIVCPYLDCSEGVSDEGGFLEIGGDIETDTSGFIEFDQEDERYICDACVERVNEDDLRSDSYGNCYCESCYNERFFYCERTEEECPIEERVDFTLTVKPRWGDRTIHVCREWARKNGIDVDSNSEYYETDLCVEVEGDWYLKDSKYIFQSDNSGEYYLIAEKVELPNGDVWARDEFDSEGENPWQIQHIKTGKTESVYDADGQAYNIEKTEKLVSLKDNWELIAGSPIKNPSFDWDTDYNRLPYASVTVTLERI